MILKVKHNELKSVEQKMLKSSEKLEYEINNLLTYLNDLTDIWQGIDSDFFYQEAYNYFNRMKSISEFFKVTSNFIDKANCEYEKSDNSLKIELEKEANEYE